MVETDGLENRCARKGTGGSNPSSSVFCSMKTTTYEATVQNGQIKLPETVHLPDHTKVFVVVPDTKAEPFSIVTGEDGLPVIRTANGVITSQLVKDIEAQLA